MSRSQGFAILAVVVAVAILAAIFLISNGPERVESLGEREAAQPD